MTVYFDELVKKGSKHPSVGVRQSIIEGVVTFEGGRKRVGEHHSASCREVTITAIRDTEQTGCSCPGGGTWGHRNRATFCNCGRSDLRKNKRRANRLGQSAQRQRETVAKKEGATGPREKRQDNSH